MARRSPSPDATATSGSLLRHLDHVVVPGAHPAVEGLEQIGHRTETRLRAWTEARASVPSIRHGTNERRLRGDGECPHVRVITPPVRVALKQILLDVRRIDGRDRRVVILQVPAYRAQRFRPGEVAGDRHD